MKFSFRKKRLAEAVEKASTSGSGAIGEDPDILSPKAPSARLLSKKMVMGIIGVLGTAVVVGMYASVTAPTATKTASEQQETRRSLQSAPKEAVDKALNDSLGARKGGVVQTAQAPDLQTPPPNTSQNGGAQAKPATPPGVPDLSNAPQAAPGSVVRSASVAQGTAGTNGAVAAPPLTPAEEAKRQIAEKKIQEADKARTSSIMIGGGEVATSQPYGGSPSSQAVQSAAGQQRPPMDPSALASAQQDDQNKQQRKEDFLRRASQEPDNDWLMAQKKGQISFYEVKAGSVIPAVMIGGINSDLPGQIIAQVRENVFDTRSGAKVVIPQGTRLVGTYDAHVAYGQQQVLVVWNRMVFPDGTSMNIRGMPGADQSGYAGFKDQVDNHYVRIFGSAMLMSLFSAGVQLSQPQQSASAGQAPSASQTVAGALGQQLGQVGTNMANKNLNIQPTLEIRPGYRFNVMVTKDIVLGSYQG